MDYLRLGIENQLTEIYKDYEQEPSSGKKKVAMASTGSERPRSSG
jgi:hypothetical protein